MASTRLDGGWSGLVLILLGAAGGLWAQTPPTTPHLLAPADKYTVHCDPLAAEAALRLVSAELAARYGLASSFVPVDQQTSVVRQPD